MWNAFRNKVGDHDRRERPAVEFGPAPQHGVDDARVQALFDELHDTVTSPADAALATGTGS